MSKKRVHEIAKELKSHGIELDNKDVVNELVALGYDVKSHSSSLEDDQAIAAVQKIVEKKKPKAPAAPVAAKGFVRRPARPGAAPPAAAVATAPQTSAEQRGPPPPLTFTPPPELVRPAPVVEQPQPEVEEPGAAPV